MTATVGRQESATPVQVSATVARRYLLGRQGLWPGRRWLGKAGAAKALRALESLQMDAVAVVARSHDLALFARVAEYRPTYLDQLLYTDRAFFDYGGHLDIYPVEELPYWRLHMKRRRDSPRETQYRDSNRVLLRRVLSAVTEQGPLLSGDVAWAAPTLAQRRSTTDVGQALYHLWMTGELMTHSRLKFRRTYDLAARIAPPALLKPSTFEQARHFFAAKTLRRLGLGAVTIWRGHLSYQLHATLPRETWRRWLNELLATHQATWVEVEGVKRPYLAPADEVALLDTLAQGLVPPGWNPVTSSTSEEALLLSPLDNLLHPDRQSTLELLGFEFLWEIYKPAAQRRWGAYTMPVLYQDRLVARVEPRLDRQRGSLEVVQVWLEDPTSAADPNFLSALARGLVSLAKFHDASRLDCGSVEPLRLRQSLRRAVREAELETR